MRHQLDSYPYRQLPRYVEEGDIDLVQSMVGASQASSGCCQGGCRSMWRCGDGAAVYSCPCHMGRKPVGQCSCGPVVAPAVSSLQVDE
jgi:hypothetical protein